MRYGLIIVTIAIIGAIFCGSVAIEREPYTETAYERITDLTPIVSYSPVMGDVNYNPTSNLTGWQNATFTTQDIPSIYTHVDAWTTSTFTSGSILSYGGHYYPNDAAQVLYDAYPAILWEDTDLDGPATDANPWGWTSRQHMIGGYDSSDSGYDGVQIRASVSVRANIGGTSYGPPANGALWWQDLNAIARASWDNGAVVTITNSAPNGIYRLDSITLDSRAPYYHTEGVTTYYDSYANLTMTASPLTIGDTYWFNKDTGSFYRILSIGPNNQPVFNATPVNLVWVSNASNTTLTITQYHPGSVEYITPYTDVKIANGESAQWSNGYRNSSLQLIVDPTAIIGINGGTYTLQLPAYATTWPKALITLNSDESSYWQAVTAYNTPYDYVVLPYQYPLNIEDNDAFDALSVANSTTAAVVNTWIPADPQRLLWHNPTMDLGAYFPENIAAGARVVFASVLTTGESLTINGTTYSTGDGRIIIDGESYAINSLTVEYLDGRTIIKNARGAAVVDDPTVDTTISGAGVWYWSASLDNITTTVKEKSAYHFGEGAAAEWYILVFIGLMIAAIVVFVAVGKGSLDLWDWAIMILAGIIGLAIL